MPVTPPILLVKGKAGLGNRLLSVLSSILYADASGRELVIDWRDPGYSVGLQNSFPKFFSSPVVPAEPWNLTRTSVAPSLWADHLDETVDQVMERYEADPNADQRGDVYRKYTVDLGRVDYRQELLVRWAYFDELYRVRRHFHGDLAGLAGRTDFQVLSQVARERLVLQAPIRARIDDIVAERFGEVTIGVHIRYTDRRNSYDHFPSMIDWILRRHPEATVFLATDNREVEAAFAARYQRLVVTDKWYPDEPGRPMHQVRACPDKTALGIEALVEMYLLGRCDYLIYNQTSTFGMVARLLGGERQKAIDTAPTSARTIAKQAYRWLQQRW